MSKPRYVIPGQYYKITRRCTQRQFLLRPDNETNNNFIYCLALAAHKYNVQVIATCAMSNHHHTDIYDAEGNLPLFLHYFHQLLARSQNALRKRWENFWASGATSVVRLPTPADILDRVVYTLTNPVKDFLVEEVHHWPGVNSWLALRTNRPLTAKRPRHFFRTHMPAEVTLHLTTPSEFGTRAAFVTAVAERISDVQMDCKAICLRSNRKILGRRQVLKQSHRDAPTTHAPRGKMSPRVSTRSFWEKIEILHILKVFVQEHRAAYLRWKSGEIPNFPPGTWAMRHLVTAESASVCN